MSHAILAALITAAMLILGGLLKVSRQAGRIEQGVAGLYDRVNRLERWIDSRESKHG